MCSFLKASHLTILQTVRILKIRLRQRFRAVKASNFQTYSWPERTSDLCIQGILVRLGRRLSLMESIGWPNSQTNPCGDFCSAVALCYLRYPRTRQLNISPERPMLSCSCCLNCQFSVVANGLHGFFRVNGIKNSQRPSC